MQVQLPIALSWYPSWQNGESTVSITSQRLLFTHKEYSSTCKILQTDHSTPRATLCNYREPHNIYWKSPLLRRSPHHMWKTPQLWKIQQHI